MQKQQLKFFDLIMIVVSLVIGMGIFKTPGQVAGYANDSTIFFLAWSLGGLIAICGALTFAEIGSRLPVSGGYYRIFSYCYHPAFAFMLNGTILISNAASVAGVALIGAEYSSQYIFPGIGTPEQEQTHHLLIASAMILLFFGLNLLGLKTSARTQNILTIFKLVVVTALCFAIFFPDHDIKPLMETVQQGQYGFLKSIGLCLIPISFTYGGYQQTINFGGEVENAPRIMPRAIIIGMLVVTFLYLAINYAYFTVIGFEKLKSAESIGAFLADRIFGKGGGKVLSMLLFFSVLAYVNVGLLSNPRVILAMSEEGTLPKLFSRHSKRFNVPVTALVAFTIFTLAVLFFAKTFEQLVNYVIFLDSLGFLGAATTIFILRRRKTGEKDTIYKMKLYPLAPIVFILAYLGITISVVAKDWRYALIGLCIFFAFIIPYFILTSLSKRSNGK